jgi:short-subunit dehydrogenase
MTTTYPRVDVLVNNGGALNEPLVPFLQTDPAKVNELLQINTMGPLKLCKAFLPSMVAHKYGRIVNMSSGTASLTEMNGKHVSIDTLL